LKYLICLRVFIKYSNVVYMSVTLWKRCLGFGACTYTWFVVDGQEIGIFLVW